MQGAIYVADAGYSYITSLMTECDKETGNELNNAVLRLMKVDDGSTVEHINSILYSKKFDAKTSILFYNLAYLQIKNDKPVFITKLFQQFSGSEQRKYENILNKYNEIIEQWKN